MREKYGGYPNAKYQNLKKRNGGERKQGDYQDLGGKSYSPPNIQGDEREDIVSRHRRTKKVVRGNVKRLRAFLGFKIVRKKNFPELS